LHSDAFHLPREIDEALDRFLVIVCTEKPDTFLLLKQDPIELGEIKNFSIRGAGTGKTKDMDSFTSNEKLDMTSDWFTKSLTVKTTRCG